MAASAPRVRQVHLRLAGGALAIAGIVSRPCLASAQGFRLDLSTYVAFPDPRGTSARVFEGLGQVRPGLGMDLGIGYDRGAFGLGLSGGFASIEVGEPVTRNGIGMGREPGIYRSAALVGQWNPGFAMGRWRPTLSLGAVRTGIDNVLLRADSLPEFARPLASAPDSMRRPAGISGSGLRLGLGFQRDISTDFAGRMTLALRGAVDVVRFGRMEYDRRRGPIPAAPLSLVSRGILALHWSPRAP